MSTDLATRLDRAVQALPLAYAGPGGAVAVVRNGEVLVRHSWGWANAERRSAFTPQTLFRICSITKQFVCGLVLDAFPDPAALDSAVAARLSRLEQPAPGALHLCHNQSGLRDYWAVAMLHGSPAEAPFGETEADRVIRGTRTLQFAPGTSYSYVNQNFRILSDILQDRTGRSLAELLRSRIFDRAGMHGAILAADTRALPDGADGYEGSQAAGFRPATNRILWTGDAGIGASLDDMIAWERFIDAGRDDGQALYSRLSRPVSFANGAPAADGFGLARREEFGRPVTGHGGGLRGWISHRLHMPSERLSVVVLFNHMADARSAALDLLAAILDETRPTPSPAAAAPDWQGAYLEPETGLAVRIGTNAKGQLQLRYDRAAAVLDRHEDGTASNDGTKLRPAAEGLWMDRPAENQSSLLRKCAAAVDGRDIAGTYDCAELDAQLTIADMGGVLYGAFAGFLGSGRMELLDPVARDVWALPCPRALDHAAPGDWTLAVRRDAQGRPESVQVGCWLARNLTYRRTAPSH
jgi:D-aminopeptidase